MEDKPSLKQFFQGLPSNKVMCVLARANDSTVHQTLCDIARDGINIEGSSDTKLMADIFIGQFASTPVADHDELVSVRIESIYPIYTDTNERTAYFVHIDPNPQSSGDPSQYTYTVGRAVEHYANGMDQPPTSTETVNRTIVNPSYYLTAPAPAFTYYNQNQHYFTVGYSLGVTDLASGNADPGIVFAEATPW